MYAHTYTNIELASNPKDTLKLWSETMSFEIVKWKIVFLNVKKILQLKK